MPSLFQNGSSTAMYESATSSTTPVSTPMTPVSSQGDDAGETKLGDINKYIALGCLHFDSSIPVDDGHIDPTLPWIELQFASLPDEVKAIIGKDATRLLEAGWVRFFLHCLSDTFLEGPGSIVRVYLLPEDWGRRLVDRRVQSLRLALRQLLSRIDISAEAWSGHHSGAGTHTFDPWATAQSVSLFYLFNKLPSPAPSAEQVKNRYSRNAVLGLLEAASPITYQNEYDVEPIPGLKTRLYSYQARSAAQMVQREAAPQLQLDPRLEVRMSPTGKEYFFGAREGSFLQEPRYYETNRGGILAETMGLGKTIICLAMILATKGHMPQIPGGYAPPPPTRKTVGSLADMAANIIGRKAIPGRAYLENLEAEDGLDRANCKYYLDKNIPYYEIPVELPRMNRNTRVPPPQQLVMCGGTIVVVPRNLLHQWQSEIQKHVVKGALKILVMDSKPQVSKVKAPLDDDAVFEMRHELPLPTELMKYDIILFTQPRFKDEIKDGQDDQGRRLVSGAPLKCECTYIGATRIRDCHCLSEDGIYQSPLKKLHWLRIIIDEGHNFSSAFSDHVKVAKQLHAERRWVVSGTPAKSLVGVEVDLSTRDQEDGMNETLLRERAMEQRKSFGLDDDNMKAAAHLGQLASNFLMVRPWSDSTTEAKLSWENYIYRHEHHHLKTYSGFSTCFSRALEGLVVKTRPEDVERDIQLPPMRHRTVYLKPCWFDKMTANLFIQVLRANAITSERSDVDYLFHKNSIQARHSLIRNLRQSNFTWTGFSLEDVASTLETSSKYLDKSDKKCSVEDANELLESSNIVSRLMNSEGWIALSKAHEVGMAVENWPQESELSFALAYPEKPSMIGITQLLEGQSHVDNHILSEHPEQGLDIVGQDAKARLLALEEADKAVKRHKKESGETKTGVPSSAVGGQPVTSRRTSIMPMKTTPKKGKTLISTTPAKTNLVQDQEGFVQGVVTTLSSQSDYISFQVDVNHTLTSTTIGPNEWQANPQELTQPASPVRPKKRRLTLADETAELPIDSSLRKTHMVGTTSAKLTYLIEMVVKHQADEKIIIFYDGDNAAYYIAQCLEMLYINHRIYARTLDNTKRSQYVALFNEDPSVRVLLIDVACGALGLNLNVASVVLIVNPINRPGIEAQAIKRAHRIGQTREVLVETLVLEGTIEEAIFKRAKKMSRTEHQEAKTLEDDQGIIEIIQNAGIIPVMNGEDKGMNQYALLNMPQQVFGRPGRDKYHKFGQADAKTSEKSKKRVRKSKSVPKKSEPLEVVGSTTPPSLQADPSVFNSIFGSGILPTFG